VPDLQNRHVRAVRYSVAANSKLGLPKLTKESLLVCIQCDDLVRSSDSGEAEPLRSGPAPVLWNRGGVSYSLTNRSQQPAELMLVELEDSLALIQLRVPYSERDPMAIDDAHFSVLLENAHARVMLLRLPPRERTEEVQFASRLEVALTDAQINEELAGASLKEVSQPRGDIAWKENQLKSILNAGDGPLEQQIIELRHPFCYPVHEDTQDWQEKHPNWKKYAEEVREEIGKRWLKKMPRSIREGDTGLVTLQFELEHDGTVGEDGIKFVTLFGTSTHVEKAVSAIRDSGAFPPLPADFDKPRMELRFMFMYNLSRNPPSCRE